MYRGREVEGTLADHPVHAWEGEGGAIIDAAPR